MTKQEVIDHFGGASAAAKALTDAGYRCTRQAVGNWTDVPPSRQIQINKMTRGKLKITAPEPKV